MSFLGVDKKVWLLVLVLLVVIGFSYNSGGESADLVALSILGPSGVDTSSVEEFVVEDYMGLWYELARYPNRFQADCLCSTAEYELVDGVVSVNNTCYNEEGSFDGILGKAFLTGVPGVLQVQFFPVIRSDYRVLYVSEDYDLAVVSDRRGSNLWLLSRDSMGLDELLGVVEEKGFDVDKLIINDVRYCESD